MLNNNVGNETATTPLQLFSVNHKNLNKNRSEKQSKIITILFVNNTHQPTKLISIETMMTLLYGNYEAKVKQI